MPREMLGGDMVKGDALEANGATRNVREHDLREETRDFLQLVIDGLRNEAGTQVDADDGKETRRFLEKLSASRAQIGQESHQTAYFIFALKGPLFTLLQAHYREQPALLAEQLWEISQLLDAFGLHTIRTYQKNREAVIKRQQEELLELSTPVVKLWEGVLALPLIGTLDSQRSQTVMARRSASRTRSGHVRLTGSAVSACPGRGPERWGGLLRCHP